MCNRREDLYNCTKRISSQTIKAELKPIWADGVGRRELRYRIHPASRYAHLPSNNGQSNWELQPTRGQMREMAKAAEEEEQRRREVEAKEEQRRREAEAKYEMAFAEWSDRLKEAQSRHRAAVAGYETLVSDLAVVEHKAAEASKAALASRELAEAKRKEVEEELDALRAKMNRQSFAVKDLEASRAAHGGALSDANSAKLVGLQERLWRQQAQIETLEDQKALASVDDGAGHEAAAAAAAEQLIAIRQKLNELSADKDKCAVELAKVKSKEPPRPEHMALLPDDDDGAGCYSA